MVRLRELAGARPGVAAPGARGWEGRVPLPAHLIRKIAPVFHRFNEAEGYGEDWKEPGALLSWTRAIRGARPRGTIKTAGGYVAAVRRLAFRVGVELPTRGSLIAVGWNSVSPGEFLELVGEWQRYWSIAAERPETVGSPLNPMPEDAWRAFRNGLPAWAAGKLTHGNGVKGRQPLTKAAMRRYCRKATALGRAGIHNGFWKDAAVGADLLRLLGRLTAGEQRRLLACLPEQHPAHAAHREECARIRAERGENAWGHMPEWPSKARWREAHVDWAKFRALEGMIRAGGPRVEAAWELTQHIPTTRSVPRRVLEIAEVGAAYDLGAWLTPNFPLLSAEKAARLVRGESPVQLSDGLLSKKEAHAWCLDGALELSSWLQSQLLKGVELPSLRSVGVIRWLAEVQRRKGWGQLTRTRIAHGPGGEAFEYRFLDRIDEIMDEDLPRGIHTGVEEAFERASERAGSAWQEQNRQNHRVLAPNPPWRIFPRCSRWLNTPALLVAEGQAMGHCVGTYAPAVEQRQCYILAINVGGHRSTAELSPTGYVVQHRAEKNSEPHPLCAAVLDRIQRKNGLK